MTRSRNPWLGVGFDVWSLAGEAQQVVGLRALKLAAGGPEAEAEVRRMVAEKLDAAAEIQRLAMTGGLGLSAPAATLSAVRNVRRKVRANRRRLLRS